MSKNFLTKSCILSLLFFLFYQSALAQQQENFKAIAHFDSVRKAMPREKLYVQLDKVTYTTQDTVWFKAYLTNASLGNYSNTSQLIYAEIIDDNGEIVKTIALPTIFGVTWGSFAIAPNKYKSGKYTFRAYTNWMQNFGDTYYFKKEIKIFNLDTEQSDSEPVSTKVIVPKKSTTTTTLAKIESDVQFLPEGGNWQAGKMQKIAFKAIDVQGKSIEISGEIIDSKQNKVADFKSNSKGMGFFELLAQPNEQYIARIKYANGFVKEKPLPKTIQIGTFLKVDHQYGTDSIAIHVFSNLPDQDLNIIGQSRGIICMITKFKGAIKSRTFKVAKSAFPTGVCQIIITDATNKILNERNFFINHNDELKITANSNASFYGTRDSIAIHMQVNDISSKPTTGSFSVAVTADDQVQKDSLTDANILTYFLLSSDLKGEIENPGYYFKNMDSKKYEELDALMLTQGWVNYSWDLSKKPLFKAQKEFTISGKVTNITNKPVENAKIILLRTSKDLMLLDTLTNKYGEFVFRNLPALDSASFVIQAKNSRGKNGTLGIELNEFKQPPFLIPIVNKKTLTKQPTDSIAAQLVATKKQENELAIRSGVLLREVKITGKKAVRDSKNLNGPGEADQTITAEELEKMPKKTLLQILEAKVKGFRTGSIRKTRMLDYFINSDVLRLIIDGIKVEFFYEPTGFNPYDEHLQFLKSYFDYYTAEDIIGIEVMSSMRNSTLYKNQYENTLDETDYAFLEITTKTGAGPFLRKAANMYLYKPITYGSKKAFYSPKYTQETKKAKNPDFRSTIFWDPNLVPDKDGNATFSFFSADQPGKYTVWIEGTDLLGNFGVKVFKLEIKPAH